MVEEFRFAKDIESMIEFRKSAGLSVCATRSMSKMLREYCLSQRTTRPRLTKEVAAGWLAWESEKGRKGLSHKATFLRLLARFINATGGSAYELPVVCTPKNNGFSPHIFSNDEPSRLFQEIDRYEDRGKIVEVNRIHNYSSLNCSVSSGIREKIRELLFYHFGWVNFSWPPKVNTLRNYPV